MLAMLVIMKAPRTLYHAAQRQRIQEQGRRYKQTTARLLWTEICQTMLDLSRLHFHMEIGQMAVFFPNKASAGQVEYTIVKKKISHLLN